MNPIIRTLHGKRQYIIAFTLFLLVSFIYCSLYSKTNCFINLNGIHTDSLNAFFTWYTMLGDGCIALVLFVVLLCCRRYLQGVHILAAFLTSGLAAQLIKRFTHMPRPRVLLHAGQYNQFIEGVSRSGWTSFPSGHTATAFAIATVMALYSTNKWFSLIYLLLAIGVGYSRIYLGSHFLEDVLAGSIIGVVFGSWVFVAIPELTLFGRRIGEERSVVLSLYNN